MSRSADALAPSDGRWVTRRMVAHLVAPPAPPEPARVDELIACPLCHATLTEPCRTPGGNWTIHAVRLVSRRCPCGNRPREGSLYCCDECRHDARTATYRRREQRAPTRSRRAA